METKFNLHKILSIFFLCLAPFMYSQESTNQKKSVGDVVYEEYRQNGINKALDKYRDLKANNQNDYNFTEYELNRIGYQIMHNEGDLEAAEKVFNLNMGEYPKAANPQDSYADYLLEKGDKEAARKYLEKSVSMAEKSDRKDEKDLLKMSKAKLAKLDNKHKQLDFLKGDWEVKGTSFEEGIGGGELNGRDEIIQSENENMITVNHYNASGEVMAKRIMVYNALEDNYDVAFINNNAPMGFQISTMKLKDLGDGTIELTEQYQDDDGTAKKYRHTLKKKSDRAMDWVIFESDANKEDWKKVYAMEMNRN